MPLSTQSGRSIISASALKNLLTILFRLANIIGVAANQLTGELHGLQFSIAHWPPTHPGGLDGTRPGSCAMLLSRYTWSATTF